MLKYFINPSCYIWPFCTVMQLCSKEMPGESFYEKREDHARRACGSAIFIFLEGLL
jgi:hypothetical protein